MKQRLQRFLLLFGKGVGQVVRRHPVELALLASAAVWLIVANESLWRWYEFKRVWLLPVAAVWVLVIDTLAGDTRWRKIVWAAWLPLVPLMLWNGLAAWIETQQFAVTSLILTPLALLLSRRATDNGRFADDAAVYLRSAVLAMLFANVALGLFEAILWSTAYIFGFTGANWVDSIAIDTFILTEFFFAPLLFLMMRDRWMDAPMRRSRVMEVLVNYIVTPALMAYAAILCLYILRIVVTRSLPEGGVAYMVLIFALITLIVRGVHERFDKRFVGWFYRAYGLVMLPAALLFWAGVVRRVGEYGLTEPRVWLIACGGLMSLSVVLLFSRRTGRYYYLAAAAFVCFAALVYIPALRPARLAVRNQVRRVERTAASLGMLSPDGRILSDRFDTDRERADAYRRLYTSLDYIAYNDPEDFARFGITMEEFRSALSPLLYNRVVLGRESESYYRREGDSFVLSARSGRSVDVAGYRKIYPDMPSWQRDSSAYYDFSDDTLHIFFGPARPPFEISGSRLLQRQLAACGVQEELLGENLPEETVDRLLVYADGEVMILFSSLYFDRCDSMTCITGMTVDDVLTR